MLVSAALAMASVVVPRITAANLRAVMPKRAPVVSLLDKQDLPRVISYDQLSRDSINDLVKKLTDEGSHVSLDDVKSGKTVEAILQDGLAVKEKMPGASKPATAAPPPNPVPLAQTNVTNKSPEAPKTPDTAAKTPVAGKSGANRLTTGTMGAVMGALVWFLP
ncbi:hypothetical protein B0O80DRAFT_503801 [Mortierella sp. GBAus27b]|nr:hypothetical protein BGX31_002300 [Mortierella sp. GBA43]KAI8346072.1 hypothetical protein B0O80DRAFT_503801 [Mortierella sp. GBAus27b]